MIIVRHDLVPRTPEWPDSVVAERDSVGDVEEALSETSEESSPVEIDEEQEEEDAEEGAEGGVEEEEIVLEDEDETGREEAGSCSESGDGEAVSDDQDDAAENSDSTVEVPGRRTSSRNRTPKTVFTYNELGNPVQQGR